MAQNSGVYNLQQQAQALTTGQWVTDPNFKATTLLLNGDGGVGSNNTFIDSSSNAFAITRNGNTTQGSFGPYGSYWSNYFNGSSNIVGSLSSALGTGDFTVEFWVYIVDNTGTSAEGGFFQTTTSSTGLSTSEYGSSSLTMQRSSVSNKYGFSLGATSVEFSNSGTLRNKWMHVACVRSSGTARIYLNGVLNSTPTSATTNLTGTYIGIGGYYSGSYLINAYISNFRVTNTVVYSSDFTPPVEPLTAISGTLFLGCQSNRFLNTNSGAAMTVNTGAPIVDRFSPFTPQYQYTPAVIGGSSYFDGSGDYLSVANDSALQIATGDFTLELWLWVVESAGANQVFLSKWNGSNGYLMFVNTSRQINFQSTATSLMTSSSTIQYGQWNHIAVVRNGNAYTLYVNGASGATTTTASTNTDGGNAFELGRNTDGGINYFKGYLSDVRLTKGGALYTTTFTPPSAPLTTTVSSGTVSLLTNMTNAGIYDNAMNTGLETVGNAQVSTINVKYGSGSMYFDGSGDYLKTSNAPGFIVGPNGDFTIEMWVFPTTIGTWRRLVGWQDGSASGSNYSYTVDLSDANKAYAQVFSGGTAYTSTSVATVTVSAWNHIAFVRSGTSVKVYLNGIGATAAVATTYNSIPSGRLYIGYDADGSSYPFTGYIDDIRITKGYARYTKNFIPPKATFANK